MQYCLSLKCAVRNLYEDREAAIQVPRAREIRQQSQIENNAKYRMYTIIE